MKRLVEKGLIYGDLLTVDTPVMRERYNDALKLLTGQITALAEFHLDISGFSPEVADELGDRQYLNHNGCNRQFILLSVEQRKCPLLEAHFSTSRTILWQFIEDNFDQLVALTARDAVVGELDNSTWRIDDVGDLVTIRNIRVQAETTRGLIADAKALQESVKRFHASDTDWWDDNALGEMCRLAERVGNIRRHAVVPQKLDYRNGNFYTSHYGGLYVLANVSQPVIISCDPDFDEPLPESYEHIPIADSAALSAYLESNELIENILAIDYLDTRTLLQERTDFMLVDVLSELDDPPVLTRMREAEFRRVARSHMDRLPEEFKTLSDVVRSIDQHAQPDKIAPDDPGYFYLQRANPHMERDLVNHLLARLTPLDFRQMFICNKEMFYQMYRSWPVGKKTYVADFLTRTYMADKHAVRENLYGVRQRPAPRPWGDGAGVVDGLEIAGNGDRTG